MIVVCKEEGIAHIFLVYRIYHGHVLASYGDPIARWEQRESIAQAVEGDCKADAKMPYSSKDKASL